MHINISGRSTCYRLSTSTRLVWIMVTQNPIYWSLRGEESSNTMNPDKVSLNYIL